MAQGGEDVGACSGYATVKSLKRLSRPKVASKLCGN
jgi:hypothetical protein